MDIDKTITFLENSFLKDLLMKDDITDISYNGQDIYYVDNYLGRLKSNISITKQEAKDFVRQIANLTEKQFSFQNPNLDVSFGKYRFNAVHQSICRKNNEECVCFSIRVASSTLRFESDNSLDEATRELLSLIINSGVSIVIGGITGSGKTELQKYLISIMKENTRVIVIDNILELDQFTPKSDLDLNIWQVDDKREEASIQNLVRSALRSNPDWLIVAELLEVLNSSLTGHPIITTIHAFDIASMPIRMTRMVMMSDHNTSFDDIYNDISYHMRFYIYLKRKYLTNGKVKRYISSIGYLNGKKMEEIYGSDGKSKRTSVLSNEAQKLLDITNSSHRFIATYLGGKK